MKENQRRFKREVFKKTLRKYLSDAGIPSDSVDFESLDISSYERVYDLIADIASNPRHEYHHIFSALLRSLDKQAEYYGLPSDLTNTPHDDEMNVSSEISEIKAAVEVIEKRLARLEEAKALEQDEVATELHNAVYELNHQVVSLRDRVAALERRREGPSPKGPPKGPKVEGQPARGLKVGLAMAITLLLGSTIMPTAAYTNQWSLAETVMYGLLFSALCLGLMVLEGLWVSVSFNRSRRTAHGFVTGYIYSQHANPYKSR